MKYQNKNFYKNLPEIDRFSNIVNLNYFVPVPDDWLVVATDIRGSTKAIENGKYKSVNMAGACAIAAICNEFTELEIPFVFGGDGATLAIPDVGRERIMGLLKFCKEATMASFGLELAAGCCTMAELRKHGKEIKIARFRLSKYVQQAIFWGSGVDFIEELIKTPENNLDDFKTVKADLSGLECRWNEIPSGKDEILSIIIKSTLENELDKSRFYQLCFQAIDQIYGETEKYAPVTEDNMSLAANPLKLSTEAKIRSYPSRIAGRIMYYAKLLYLQLVGRYLMKYEAETKHTRWGDYKQDFVKNADFRKFSDGLKLVVSGTREQSKKLRLFLEEELSKGNVVFGLHSSPSAMSTCFVTDYQGRHIHFIDGTEGGYAAASLELKQQLNKLMQNTTDNNPESKHETTDLQTYTL